MHGSGSATATLSVQESMANGLLLSVQASGTCSAGQSGDITFPAAGARYQMDFNVSTLTALTIRANASGSGSAISLEGGVSLSISSGDPSIDETIMLPPSAYLVRCDGATESGASNWQLELHFATP